MATNWHGLRTWNGSQERGFEELCCQLAAGEPYPMGSQFIRKGAPDAGVECFWPLPSGDEHGWPGKVFPASPTTRQWSQVDASVKTALEKHPKLTKYIVCLAVDRPDPRLPNQKSSLHRWNERVKKWQGWAREHKMSVDFVYWGVSNAEGGHNYF